MSRPPTIYALQSPVTGVLFSHRYGSATEAMLDAFDRYPAIAHLLNVMPVPAPEMDDEGITDAALDVLRHPDNHGTLYDSCPACDLMVHHSDRYDHVKSCAPLRRLASGGGALDGAELDDAVAEHCARFEREASDIAAGADEERESRECDEGGAK